MSLIAPKFGTEKNKGGKVTRGEMRRHVVPKLVQNMNRRKAHLVEQVADASVREGLGHRGMDYREKQQTMEVLERNKNFNKLSDRNLKTVSDSLDRELKD